MKNLIINAGSATHKYSLFDGDRKIDDVIYERNLSGSLRDSMKKHADVNWRELGSIAFRVVHGGNFFREPIVVSAKVLKILKSLDEVAPLHNPFVRALIEQAQKILPKVKKVLIFDTAFHKTIPEANWRYALPRSLTDKHHLRRYGFHGIVCSSIVEQLRAKKKLPQRLIICHLGSGCSVTAVRDGKSVDTSMGFTPLEGLLMGTRAGDLDPGLILHLQRTFKLTEKDLQKILNKESGLKAIAGTADMREILAKLERGNAQAGLAVEMFSRKAAKVVATSMVSLGGADLIVFSGGIGENSALIREKICAHLRTFGVKIHSKRNLRARPGDGFQKFFSSVKLSYLNADEAGEMNRIVSAM